MSFKIYQNYNLNTHNTFKVNCCAKYMAILECVDDMPLLLDALAVYNKDNLLILGDGSNILFANTYYDGLVMHIQDKRIFINTYDNNNDIICVHAGYNWHQFVQWCVDNAYYGLENLALIPGTVGAAPVQNIGAYGVEVQQFIEKIDVFNLQTQAIESLTHQQCVFAYRASIFKQQKQYIILRVYFKLKKFSTKSNVEFEYQPNLNYKELETYLSLHKLDATAHNVMHAVIAIRKNKLPDPTILGNAGSFFKNPFVDEQHLEKLKLHYPNIVYYTDINTHKIKLAAGWLIEKAGWKGYISEDKTIGVYEKQALVLINYYQTHGSHILNLAQKIQASVYTQFNVHLDIEVNVYV
jgi:UDP-N-acetylmuramate dehydrogenase